MINDALAASIQQRLVIEAVRQVVREELSSRVPSLGKHGASRSQRSDQGLFGTFFHRLPIGKVLETRAKSGK